jgi:pantetheine-phosphate adenylyltransferase
LQKAEQVFDKVIIARGVNPGKDAASYSLPDILKYRQMATYEGLLTDFTTSLGYEVTIIRGTTERVRPAIRIEPVPLPAGTGR